MEARCDVLPAYHVVFITANNVKRTRYEPSKKMCFFFEEKKRLSPIYKSEVCNIAIMKGNNDG